MSPLTISGSGLPRLEASDEFVKANPDLFEPKK
jgi:hypothetical protein